MLETITLTRPRRNPRVQIEAAQLCMTRSRRQQPLRHRFAGVFLVPGQMLQREVANYRRAISLRELFQLKQLFGVSAQAIAYRCKDLGIISQPTLAGVFKVFGIKGWRRSEPNALPKERPSRFERLCIRALAEDVISEAKASGAAAENRSRSRRESRPPAHRLHRKYCCVRGAGEVRLDVLSEAHYG